MAQNAGAIIALCTVYCVDQKGCTSQNSRFARKPRLRVKFLVAFGVVVREARLGAALSQEELASRAGLHRNSIGLVERGEMALALDSVDQLCTALGYRPWQLLLEAERRARR